jgi:radical SAM superfamily enzyme YgiQ (UPF0313 family)
LEKGKLLASGSWLARPADDVVAEMMHMHARYGLDELLIVDDEFFGGSELGRERALRIADMMIERGSVLRLAISCRAENMTEQVFARLRQAGLNHVFIGVESGSADDLRFYAKGHSVQQSVKAVRLAKSLGLSVQCGFMMFTPNSTIRQLRENIEFLKEVDELKPVSLNSTVDPHFGTPLIRRMERDGVLIDDELSMSTVLRDPQVRLAKSVTQRVMDRYFDYMRFLVRARSSITFEWRRPVPKRTVAEERLLDAFERTVNTRFCGIVEDALDAIEARASLTELHQDLDRQLASVESGLALAQALVISRLEVVEGGLRYWSHKDLMDSKRAMV